MYFSKLIPLELSTSSSNCPETITQNVSELSNSLVPSQRCSPLITAVSRKKRICQQKNARGHTRARARARTQPVGLFHEPLNLVVEHTLTHCWHSPTHLTPVQDTQARTQKEKRMQLVALCGGMCLSPRVVLARSALQIRHQTEQTYSLDVCSCRPGIQMQRYRHGSH